jgi:hypothetical protein
MTNDLLHVPIPKGAGYVTAIEAGIDLYITPPDEKGDRLLRLIPDNAMSEKLKRAHGVTS